MRLRKFEWKESIYESFDWNEIRHKNSIGRILTEICVNSNPARCYDNGSRLINNLIVTDGKSYSLNSKWYQWTALHDKKGNDDTGCKNIWHDWSSGIHSVPQQNFHVVVMTDLNISADITVEEPLFQIVGMF